MLMMTDGPSLPLRLDDRLPFGPAVTQSYLRADRTLGWELEANNHHSALATRTVKKRKIKTYSDVQVVV